MVDLMVLFEISIFLPIEKFPRIWLRNRWRYTSSDFTVYFLQEFHPDALILISDLFDAALLE